MNTHGNKNKQSKANQTHQAKFPKANHHQREVIIEKKPATTPLIPIERPQKMPVAEDVDDRCWICLGAASDPPPPSSLSTVSPPSQTHELIQTCNCSLRAHKQCLLDWASSLDSQPTQTNVNADGTGFVLNNRIGLNTPMGPSVIRLRSPLGFRVYSNDKVKCPQCQRPILLKIKPSVTISLTNFFKELAKIGSQLTVMSYVGSSLVATLAMAGFSTLVSVGFAGLRSLAPQSVILKMLGINERDFDGALQKGKIGFTDLGLIGLFPLFLISLRGDSGSSFGLLRSVYPLLYLAKTPVKSWEDFRAKDPRFFLLAADPLHSIYKIAYALILNRVYYRWCYSVKSWFINNRLPQDELQEVERENTEFFELRNQRLLEQSHKKKSIWKRIAYWLNPHYTAREKELIQHRNKREIKAVFLRDYSEVFAGSTSSFVYLTNTLLWPIVGSFIGTNLIHPFTPLRTIINQYVNTPDEAIYLSNLLGSAVVVLLKDLYNLIIVYKKYSQFRDIDIVDREFTGFEIDKITNYRITEVPGEFPADVPANIPEDNLPEGTNDNNINAINENEDGNTPPANEIRRLSFIQRLFAYLFSSSATAQHADGNNNANLDQEFMGLLNGVVRGNNRDNGAQVRVDIGVNWTQYEW